LLSAMGGESLRATAAGCASCWAGRPGKHP